MRFIVFAVGLFGTAALVIIGAAWVVAMLAPVGLLFWLAVLIVRNHRKDAALADRLTREADRERELNMREYAAWRASVADARRRDSKRLRALRKFDSTRDPP